MMVPALVSVPDSVLVLGQASDSAAPEKAPALVTGLEYPPVADLKGVPHSGEIHQTGFPKRD